LGSFSLNKSPTKVGTLNTVYQSRTLLRASSPPLNKGPKNNLPQRLGVRERAVRAGTFTTLLRFWVFGGFSFNGKPFDVERGKMDATRKMDAQKENAERVSLSSEFNLQVADFGTS
jgi:hypothetical protein